MLSSPDVIYRLLKGRQPCRACRHPPSRPAGEMRVGMFLRLHLVWLCRPPEGSTQLPTPRLGPNILAQCLLVTSINPWQEMPCLLTVFCCVFHPCVQSDECLLESGCSASLDILCRGAKGVSDLGAQRIRVTVLPMMRGQLMSQGLTSAVTCSVISCVHTGLRAAAHYK